MSEQKNLVCWKCGASLAEILLPLSRMAKCKSCNADLHVCRMCEFFDKSVSKSCREPIAEEVQNKVRANFCGYLQPISNNYTSQSQAKSEAVKDDLNALFGLDTESANSDPASVNEQLNQLFGMDDKNKD